MPIPVHVLAHRPLTPEAVAELVALPFEAPVGEDRDAVEEELRRRGWDREDLVCESFRTGHGHVLCSEDYSPFGELEARTFLVFGQMYPVDPDDEKMVNGTWLNGYMEGWERVPGWSGLRPATDQDCESVLKQAAGAVTEVLDRPPNGPSCPRTSVGDVGHQPVGDRGSLAADDLSPQPRRHARRRRRPVRRGCPADV
ncbi:hypothetical protein ABT298_39115 [Streptomyces sp. NPDC001034]|uniref:hypothetical protein n=1 Tax=Streptomyces sp. NPDC001034 TaxID=3154375 RepID=UPI00331AD792